MKKNISRRDFLHVMAMAGGAGLVSCVANVETPEPTPLPTATQRSEPTQSPLGSTLIGRRRLGSLEVSSVGLGVQNMSRTYQTTIPTRSEMLNIIRTAFDSGVTFFDAAEAYGPHEVERILGEGARS